MVNKIYEHYIAKVLAATSVASLMIIGITQSQVKAVTICTGIGNCTYDYNGNTYDITTLTGTFDDLSSQLKDVTHNFWWENSTTAQAVATLIGSNLGYPNYPGFRPVGGGYSPFVTYAESLPNNPSFFVTPNSFPVAEFGTVTSNVVLSYAYATNVSNTQQVPEPFTIIGTLVGGTAALRMRKKIKSADRG